MSSFSDVIMYNAGPTCTHGDVRLVGGETSHEGRVELCHSGAWVLVCGGSSLSINDSAVACRQLTGEENPCKDNLRRTNKYPVCTI